MAAPPKLSHIRLENNWFMNLPWDSGALVEHETLGIFKSSMLAPLSSALERQEGGTLIQPTTSDPYSVYRFYCNHLSTPLVTARKMEHANFKILASYRLLDVYANLYYGPRMVNPVPESPVAVVGNYSKLPLNKLNEIGNLFSTFREKLQVLKLGIGASTAPAISNVQGSISGAPSNPTYIPTPQPCETLSPLMRLYSDFAKQSSDNKLHVILLNIMATVFYVSHCIKLRASVSDKFKGILDLHDATTITEFLLNGSPADTEEWHYIISQDTETPCIKILTSMYNSVYIALFVSPLLLLVPHTFTDIGKREKLVDIWAQLGAVQKPSEFIQAECDLWVEDPRPPPYSSPQRPVSYDPAPPVVDITGSLGGLTVGGGGDLPVNTDALGASRRQNLDFPVTVARTRIQVQTSDVTNGLVDSLNAMFQNNCPSDDGKGDGDTEMVDIDAMSDLTELSEDSEGLGMGVPVEIHSKDKSAAGELVGLGEESKDSEMDEDDHGGSSGDISSPDDDEYVHSKISKRSKEPKVIASVSKVPRNVKTTLGQSSKGLQPPAGIVQSDKDMNTPVLMAKKSLTKRPVPIEILDSDDDDIVILKHIPGLNGIPKEPAVLIDLTLELSVK
ncbi:hypothetical protein H0H92_002424 [Tricholoma furcatifolium]|nr:hypothetical protein H0H92_002424 [Tricholoma furcatifolium]